jgi:hypothetical protein
MWNKIKAWLLESLKKLVFKEIDNLDKWEPKLADMIRERLNPDEKAKAVVDYLQGELHKLVDKISDGSWVSKALGIKGKLHTAVDSLDQYEDDLVEIMRKHLDADEKATMVVDFLQDWLRTHAEKILS